MNRRLATIAAALAALAGAVLVLLAAPRLTIQNEGFRVDYGLTAVVAAALVAVAAIGLAALLRPAPARIACGLLALAAVVVGVRRGAWEVGVDRSALSARTLTETSRIAWPDVRQVHSNAEVLQVTGAGDAVISIEVSQMRPHDRATLERTIARRVQETAPAVAPPGS